MPNAPYAVVLAGGSGTRFWPASREALPKQFLALGPDPTEPLLAATRRRVAPLCPSSRLYIATAERLREITARALPDLPKEQILCEPVGRNTAPCIGWATHVIARRDPDALVMVFPADHVVGDEDAFRAALGEALAQAEAGFLTTVGIAPTRPETGFGYVEAGDALGGNAFRVERFVEKPPLERARAFVEGGRHLWNGGIFIFRARDMMRAIDEHLPELARGLRELDEAARRGDEAESLAAIYPTLPSVSIDHGVMEHASPLAVVRASFGWSDVGSWQSAWELAPKDDEGNAAPLGALFVDARGNYVRSLREGPPRTIALLGVDDLVVVETDDALLVLPRSRSQDVRQIVEALRRRDPAGALGPCPETPGRS
ncbi:MAG: mannose-1-phosphate guanylyltransferase [Polyangiaceae bacterium]|jgi:mannose-1-phosphate guanylyltransferase|nr:mannose-1-phosphate guanylyltransferase [Polyangiaceae bacterium]